MHGLIVLESPNAAAAVAEYGTVHGWTMETASSLDEAVRLSRFRHYTTVICDDSLEGGVGSAGLEIARAAKRVDHKTRTIVLATSMSPSIADAQQRGDVDVVLMKPQPLSLVYSHAGQESGIPLA